MRRTRKGSNDYEKPRTHNEGTTPRSSQEIEGRAAELIAEEMSLRDRQALKLTQERLAEALGIGQDGVSRLEKRSDLLISTLRSYVEAMGGSLSIVAEFPDGILSFSQALLQWKQIYIRPAADISND